MLLLGKMADPEITPSQPLERGSCVFPENMIIFSLNTLSLGSDAAIIGTSRKSINSAAGRYT